MFQEAGGGLQTTGAKYLFPQSVSQPLKGSVDFSLFSEALSTD